MNDEIQKPKTWSWLLLFTSTGTLLCCALPITLVSLGMGATVASMASTAPWLITLSQYKLWMFIVSGILLCASFYAIYRSGRVCPTDPELAAACMKADLWNKRFIWFSTTIWVVGFVMAYLLPVLFF